MPTSNLFQLNEITQLIKLTDPNTLLDIGIGFGKYGFLSREYLELWDGRERYDDWTRTIDGIEAFEGYITPLHRLVYNRIYVGDAASILPTIHRLYDLVLLIDVLEHFCHEDGLRVLEESQRIGRNILVSVPRILDPQEDSFGNAFEAHRFHWRRKHFAAFDHKVFLRTRSSLICYFGADCREVSWKLKKCGRVPVWKERVRPALVSALEDCHLKEPVKRLMGGLFSCKAFRWPRKRR